MKNLRIYEIICPVEWGGGENQILLRSIELKRRGVDVRIVCLAKSETLERLLTKNEIEYISVSDRKLGFSPSLTQYIWHAICLIPILIMKANILRDADIINAHGFPAIIVPPLLKLLLKGRLKARLIYTHHHYRRSKLFVRFKKLFNYLLGTYDRILAVSSKVGKESLEAVFPSLKKKMVIIPNGIDVELFVSIKDDKPTLRRRLNLPLNELLAIYVARFTPQKNHKFLLECLEHIDGFKLILAGDGPDRVPFEKAAERRGLSDRIIMTGNLQHNVLVQYLYASDICLFPSKYEGFSVAIIEAMMAGLPTIIFGQVYTEEHGNNILVAASEEEFITLAKEVIYNKHFRDRLSEKVRADALKLSIAAAVDKYLNLCEELSYKEDVG